MVRPKKHLGQHFLKDRNIAEKIVNSLSFPIGNLLEVGPGTGILTEILLKKEIDDFRVIEVDIESVNYLEQQFPALDGKIINEDFLKFDISRIFSQEVTLIGNFPYNISSQILFRVLDFRNQITVVTGMFQKEVAERISAPPGSKTYGILSVLMQAYYHIEYLFTVNESVFFPPPKVKSAVIRCKRNSRSSLDCDETLFFKVVKTAFNQRRKMLRNALGSFEFNSERLPEGILRKRAEQLSVQDFERVTCAIHPSE